jgi:chromosome segregation ATPase
LKPETIDKIIQGVVQLGTLGISAFAFVQAVREFFKERSIGKTALQRLKEEHASIKKEIEELRKDHSELSEEILGVQSKYEKLIERMLANFPFKQ